MPRRLSVHLFEALVFEASFESVLWLDPDGDGFLVHPKRPDGNPLNVHVDAQPVRPLHELSRAAVATYVIDGRGIESEAEFYRAVGEAVNGPGGYFGGSLDGLNDCLGGGMGSAEGDIQFRWTHSEVARTALGYEETVRLLKAATIHAAFINRRLERERLLFAELGLGPTIFDAIVSIFDDADVNLVLE